MKKIIYIIFLGLMIFLSNCKEDFLDVSSQAEYDATKYYKTKDQALAALTSAYDPMHWPELYGRDYLMTMEGISDDAMCEVSTWEQLVIKPGDSYVREMYDVIYKGVVRSNIVLDKIPAISMDESLKSRILAEAKFLRAYYYYHLVTIYGEVPLITKVLAPDELKLPKDKIQDILNQIETDLTDAMEVLPEKYDDVNIGRATKGAAIALLGMAYFNNPGNDKAVYQKAAEQFKKVLNKRHGGEGIGGYDLVQKPGDAPSDSAGYVDAFISVFTDDPYEGYAPSHSTTGGANNIESLFEIQTNTYIAFPNGGPFLGWGNTATQRVKYFDMGIVGAWNNLTATETLVNEYEKGDPRKVGSIWDLKYVLTDSILTVLSTSVTADIIANLKSIGNINYFSDKYFKEAVLPLVGNDQAIYETVKESLQGDLIDYRPTGKRYGKYYTSAQGKNTGYSFKKTMYPPWYGQDNMDCPYNYPVIRYANVLLMYAECVYLTGQDDPLKYINFVRERVGMPATTLTMPQALTHERRVELTFECQRYRDLVRWSRNGILDQLGKKIQDFIPQFESGKHEYLPLPEYEIDLSEGVLIQNPAYSQ